MLYFASFFDAVAAAGLKDNSWKGASVKIRFLANCLVAGFVR